MNPGEMEALLRRSAIGRLAMTTEDGPYVVAMNYIFVEGCIYLHSGPKGRKVEALLADPRVCFLVDEVGPQVTWEIGCGISQIYESVICFGKAEFVEELDEKRRVLELMVRKFIPKDSPFSLVDGNVRNTALIKIRLEWMTGKANRINPLHRIISNHVQTP